MNEEKEKVLQALLKGHEPIYEKLAHNEVFLLARAGNTIIYAVNRLGRVELKQVQLTDN
jgi:hypothetical protein